MAMWRRIGEYKSVVMNDVMVCSLEELLVHLYARSLGNHLRQATLTRIFYHFIHGAIEFTLKGQ